MKDSKVSVLMGSPRDYPIMGVTAGVLSELGLAHDVFVTSAHKTPERTHRYIQNAVKSGVKVMICGAAAAAHLAGVVAASFPGPVIAVPIGATELRGIDALLASVQMPPGVPVATVGIDQAGAHNAAMLAAQILAIDHKGIEGAVVAHRKRLSAEFAELSEVWEHPGTVPLAKAPPVALLACGREEERALDRCIDVLSELGVEHEMHRASLCRAPEAMRQLASGLKVRGAKVAICGAGGDEPLPAAVGAWFAGPVISVPLPTTGLGGVDALLASAQAPPGAPIATVAVGGMGARNAAILAAQMLAASTPDVAARVRAYRLGVAKALEKEAGELGKRLAQQTMRLRKPHE